MASDRRCVASALLSYYTAYDDTKVKDLLKDIAYNINFASEISGQLNKLAAEVARLPVEVQIIVHSEGISTLNLAIAGALIRYNTLIHSHKGADDKFFLDQVKLIYHDVSTARAQLEALSHGDNLQYAPLSAVMSPVAMLVEMGLLYRLGKLASELRQGTAKDYLAWFNRVLDPAVANSVAYYLDDINKQLLSSDQNLSGGILGELSLNLGDGRGQAAAA